MEHQWNPDKALGSAIASLDRQALCELVIALCHVLNAETEGKSYRGGIYPNNISRDESGAVGLGPARRSGWKGQELQFIAPELYWNGECGPESDVYSLGLLLWYGLSGGRLPLEGESPLAQLSRMNGSDLKAPKGCPAHLAEIVEKACRFRRSRRYRNPRALAVVLESCLANKYIDSGEKAALFKKEESELNEAERMMLDILDSASAQPPAPPPEEAPPEPVPSLDPDEAAMLILGANAPEKPVKLPEQEPIDSLVDYLFNDEPSTPVPEEPETATEPETPNTAPVPEEPKAASAPEEPKTAPRPEAPKAAPEPEAPKAAPVREWPKIAPLPETTRPPLPLEDEGEDVRVYEPGKEKKEPVPVLTVEEHPELTPIVPKRREPTFSPSPERSREIASEVRKRRIRPVGVVLVLCGLLIIAALVANHFLQDYEWEDEGKGRQISMPEVGENAIPTEGVFISVEELEQQEKEEQGLAHQSYYQIFPGDISWTGAKNEAGERGGMLAVINSADELTMITQLAQQSGMQGIWIGCHREGSYLVWETEEPTAMMTWADGEPSYLDKRDGAAEDFIMLWNTGNGWAFIDCRNDPVAADPNVYSGRVGYVCEFTS